jgi:hypothetical protein
MVADYLSKPLQGKTLNSWDMIRYMFSLVSSTHLLNRSVLNGLFFVQFEQPFLLHFAVSRTEQQEQQQEELQQHAHSCCLIRLVYSSLCVIYCYY